MLSLAIPREIERMGDVIVWCGPMSTDATTEVHPEMPTGFDMNIELLMNVAEPPDTVAVPVPVYFTEIQV